MHVLIASDGSELSIDAAHRASKLLGSADTVTLLIVVHTMPTDDGVGFSGVVYAPDEQNRLWRSEFAYAGDAIARAASRLADAPVERRIEVGDPAHIICDVAREVEADVIVVGSHGRTGLNRLFLGSVSEHVVRHAPCPVLVVRGAPDHHTAT